MAKFLLTSPAAQIEFCWERPCRWRDAFKKTLCYRQLWGSSRKTVPSPWDCMWLICEFVSAHFCLPEVVQLVGRSVISFPFSALHPSLINMINCMIGTFYSHKKYSLLHHIRYLAQTTCFYPKLYKSVTLVITTAGSLLVLHHSWWAPQMQGQGLNTVFVESLAPRQNIFLIFEVGSSF